MCILAPVPFEDLGYTYRISTGFGDLCEIGDGSRPHLFDLNIRKPKVLFDAVVEVNERVTIEDYELNPQPAAEHDLTDPALVTTESGEIVRILEPLDVDGSRESLRRLRQEGFTSVAVCFMHSHIFPGMSCMPRKASRALNLHWFPRSRETGWPACRGRGFYFHMPLVRS